MKFGIALAVLFAPGLALRADQSPPNKLTAAEIAEGWILLFDGETTFGWKTVGDVKVDNGGLKLGDAKARIETSCKFGPSRAKIIYEPAGFRSQRLRFWCSELGDIPGMPFGSGGDLGFPGGSLRLSPNGKEVVSIKSIKLLPEKLTPLFNGKDLSGWHEYKGPDAKSKFSVTPEGTLHIENGKGDLQTDKQWSDFLLQIECRTNAPALNSGVFFRCLPDKYQQGYEAQIQNSFLPAATKEYVIEKYDPQTHKLLAKDKVKYDSYDYGTGAIYRRIPARFKVAKDKEWFTMTVLAEGRHMGVWVDGIMVTDWTDNRPDNDNGRNGYKAGPGNISLQGHDPTTNLDFRNIRIVDLSPKK